MKDKKENKVKAAFVVMTAILALISMLPVMASAQTNVTVMINEFEQNPPGADSGNEWVELYNMGTEAVNISSWNLTEGKGGRTYTIPTGSIIPAQGYWSTNLPEYGWGWLVNTDESITLYDTSGSEVDKTITAADEKNDDRCWARFPNGIDTDSDLDWIFQTSTRDASNGPPDTVPPMVINASANPPVIAVNTSTELRVDAADIDSPIDEVTVTVDMSPIRGNATAMMSAIGNYTKDNITWTTYNCTTTASVVGIFDLTVNATDIDGNYNDTVNITLDVKKTVIPYPEEVQPMTCIYNVTVDAMIPDNVGKNATTDSFTSTETIDNETYYVVNTSKPTGRTKVYVDVNNVTEEVTTKRVVTEMAGVEVANLSFDPAYVMLDFPLFVGKNWTTTTNVTGELFNETIGAYDSINISEVISGNVTGEEDLTVPYGTVSCLVVEINCTSSHLYKYWISQMDDGILFPKQQQYFKGNLTEELVLIEIVAP